jgi:diguanylate cyclase (GGDEF)-like protein
VSSGTHAARTQTKPEMPAVSSGRPSLPSWVEESESDRDTEVTDLLDLGRQSHGQLKDRAVLVRLDGIEAGQVSSLDGAPLTLGRHPGNRLRIADVGISRFHARIYQQSGGVWLEDLNSQNGTYLAREGQPGERQRVTQTQLGDGDVVQLGKRVGLRFTLVDAEQEQLMRQLYESSTRDALTGAHNRKHFDDRLKSELAYALRHSTSIALIMLDIDHFKSVNDQHGHAAGDSVLQQTARSIAQRLRAEDMFARFGGEEFAVIMRGVNLAGAARLGERLRATVAALPAVANGTSIPVTVSLGCATLACLEDKTETALLRVADRRLYRAKELGRNRVVSEG